MLARRSLPVVVLGLLAAACGTAGPSAPSSQFSVTSPAMIPTLQVGDRIALTSGVPVHRGSIIVFGIPSPFPCAGGAPGGDLVKRVIGLPGETISSVGNRVYVNGHPLAEQGWYRAGLPEVGPTAIIRTAIPKGYYFVMGDNRTDSCDSRSFGPIPASSVVGTVTAIVWRNGHAYSQSL